MCNFYSFFFLAILWGGDSWLGLFLVAQTLHFLSPKCPKKKKREESRLRSRTVAVLGLRLRTLAKPPIQFNLQTKGLSISGFAAEIRRHSFRGVCNTRAANRSGLIQQMSLEPTGGNGVISPSSPSILFRVMRSRDKDAAWFFFFLFVRLFFHFQISRLRRPIQSGLQEKRSVW